MNRRERKRKRDERREKRASRALDKALSEADEIAQTVTIAELGQMALSSQASERLLALMLARKQIEAGTSPMRFVEFARRLISDRDNNCRWQAIIVIGESIARDPDGVWKVVVEYGNAVDEDMRSAIACVLLEHLLDTDFERYFPLVQDQVRSGRHRFLDTMAMCWFNDRGANYQLTQRWIEEARRGSR